MQTHLHIMATITPKTEYFEQAKAALVAIVEPTLKEQGCLQFKVHQDADSLYLYEEWLDQAALDLHYQMPYISAVFEAYQQWLAKPVDIRKLTRLA